MKLSILVCDPDEKAANETAEYISNNGYIADVAHTGKEAQLKLYQKKYTAVVLDFALQNHSSLSVLKYIKFNSPSTRILFVIEKKEVLTDLGLSSTDMKNLGVFEIIEKPISSDILLKKIEFHNNPHLWKSVKKSESSPGGEIEITEEDAKFDSVPIEAFYSGNTAIYDLHIKLNKSKYLKILHRGDHFERERLQKYIDNPKITHFYFRTEDRILYINFINTLLSKINQAKGISSEVKVDLSQSLSQQYLTEVYTNGMNPRIVQEGIELCDNLYGALTSNADFKAVMDKFAQTIDDSMDHSFLVAFFALNISKHLSWITERTRNKIGMGALLHDIGKLKFSDSIKNKKREELTTPEQIAEYKQHCQFGSEILNEYPFIETPVRQIVLQHHEKVDGSGFPLAITSIKIFPMAKIVCLANDFVHTLQAGLKESKSNRDILEEFVRNPDKLQGYDQEVVRALICCFRDQSKKAA